MVWATLCPDAEGPLAAALVATLVTKPAPTSAIVGKCEPENPKQL